MAMLKVSIVRDAVVGAPVRVDIEVPGRGTFSQLRWGDDPEKPILHFAHATGFNAETYRTLLSPLTDQFRVLATDLRGHGFTTAEADPEKLRVWSIYADDLVALLDTMDEPAFLSGHSMGGAVSLMCAARRPEKVRGLMLADPVMIPQRAVVVMQVRRQLGLKSKSPLVAGARRRRAIFASREAMIESYTGRGAFTSWPVEMIRDYALGGTRNLDDGQVELTCAPAWEAGTFQSAGGRMSRFIEQSKCPATILYAESESTLRGQMADMIRRLQPDWQVKRVDGTSHFLPMEKPDVIRAEIRALADRC